MENRSVTPLPRCPGNVALVDCESHSTSRQAEGFLPPLDTLPNEELWHGLYPFETARLEVDGCSYHYVDENPNSSQQTLLFVHGNPTWSFHWRELIEHCRDRYRCIAPDHLGCGYSDLQPRPLRLADHIENLRCLIQALDLQRVTLVAQDWGGAIGLGALLEERQRFERIVLLNTGAFKPWFIPWRIRVSRWPIFGKLALQGANAFSRAALRMTLSRQQQLDPRVEAAYLAPYHNWQRRAAVHQFVRDIPLSATHPTWNTLSEIEGKLDTLTDIPKRLIWGMKDWCFTPECLEKFCKYWPQAQVHRIADAGHWVLEDATDEVVSSVREFLSQSPSPTAGIAT